MRKYRILKKKYFLSYDRELKSAGRGVSHGSQQLLIAGFEITDWDRLTIITKLVLLNTYQTRFKVSQMWEQDCWSRARFEVHIFAKLGNLMERNE